MRCIDEWDRGFQEGRGAETWASIGASALVTALIVCVIIGLILKFK